MYVESFISFHCIAKCTSRQYIALRCHCILQHSVLQCTAAAPVVVGLTSDSPLGCVYTTHTLCTTFEEMKMLECAAVRCNRINKKRANRTQSKYFPLLRKPTYPTNSIALSIGLFFHEQICCIIKPNHVHCNHHDDDDHHLCTTRPLSFL